jgi:hypothetical protein
MFVKMYITPNTSILSHVLGVLATCWVKIIVMTRYLTLWAVARFLKQ